MNLIEQIKEAIINLSDYRGQIIFPQNNSFDGEKPKYFEDPDESVKDYSLFFKRVFNKELYKHQFDIAKHLISSSGDLILNIIKGCGTRTCLDSLSFFDSVYSAKKVIYISKRKHLVFNRLISKKKEYLEGELVSIANEFNDKSDILVLSPDELRKYLISEKLQLLGTFDRTIIEDIHNYSPSELYNVRLYLYSLKFIRKLTISDNNLQVILISPFNSKVRELADYFELVNTKFISNEYSSGSKFNLLYWFSPLESKEYDKTNSVFKIERVQLSKDFKLLLKILNEAQNKLKILILQNVVAFGVSEVEILLKIKSKHEINITNDISLLDNHEYDIIISLSVPFVHINILQQFSKFLNENGLLIIVLFEEYKTTQILRSNKYDLFSDEGILPRIFFLNPNKDTENLKSLESYYKLSLGSSTLPEGNKFVSYMNVGINSENGSMLKIPDTSSILTISNFEKEIFFQDGMIKLINGYYYEVVNDGKVFELKVYDGSLNFSYPTFSGIKINDKFEDGILEKITISSNDIQFRKIIGKYNLDFEVNGYFSSEYSFQSNLIKINKKKELEFDNWTILILDSFSSSSNQLLINWYSALLKFMDLIAPNLREKFIIVEQNDSIYIIPLLNSEEFVNQFDSLINEFLQFLKEFIFDLFSSCICKDGCGLCSLDVRLRNKDIAGGKNILLKWISDYNNLDKSEVDSFIEARTSSIKNERFLTYLDLWKKNILNILNEKFLIRINDLANIHYDVIEDENILGSYSSIENRIVINSNKKFNEKDMVEVLAHEMAHNWQKENMAEENRKNKYLVEGFAQWISFRIMDHLGIIENMQELKLSSIDISPSSNEYELGFYLIVQLEKEYGTMEIFKFLKEGALTKDGLEKNIDSLIKYYIGIYLDSKE